MGRCNACGGERKLDTDAQAGKVILKELPTFYANNPEFKGKQNKAVNDIKDMSSSASMKKGIEQPVESKEQKEQANKRAQKIIESGGEINELDAKAIDITSQEMA